MPTRKDIELEVAQRQTQSNDTIRRNYLKELHEYTKRDTIVYASGFTNPKIQGQRIPSSFISITTHDIQGFMSALYGLKGKELDLIIHSPGGLLEAADQMVQYLRSKYNHIRAIVPQNAMSAATMICCACDSIVMGKHSAIGPIDPQIDVPIATGRFTAPAHALLEEFEKAKQEVKQDIKTAPSWVKR